MCLDYLCKAFSMHVSAIDISAVTSRRHKERHRRASEQGKKELGARWGLQLTRRWKNQHLQHIWPWHFQEGWIGNCHTAGEPPIRQQNSRLKEPALEVTRSCYQCIIYELTEEWARVLVDTFDACFIPFSKRSSITALKTLAPRK